MLLIQLKPGFFAPLDSRRYRQKSSDRTPIEKSSKKHHAREKRQNNPVSTVLYPEFTRNSGRLEGLSLHSRCLCPLSTGDTFPHILCYSGTCIIRHSIGYDNFIGLERLKCKVNSHLCTEVMPDYTGSTVFVCSVALDTV